MIKQEEYPSQSVVTQQENPWSQYFGSSPYPILSNTTDKTSYDRFDLPEAYRGRNLFLANTIDSFIIDNADLDFTRVILPIVQTDQINIAYNIWSFNETLVGRTPFEGTSRLLRSQKSSFSDKLVRRGLAFMLEHGFMNTQEGRQQYVQNIKEIVKAVQLTMSFDVLSTLLTCKRYNVSWEKEHGYFEQRLSDIMKREVHMFGIVQKDPNGFDILLEEHKKHMNRYSVNPDALILPSKIQIYLPMVPEQKIMHYNRGDLGVQQFEAGSITVFRGINVYESKMYDLNDGEIPVNLMSSIEQIGQFNMMSCESVLNAKEYKSSHRDIYIFDANLDNFRKISFSEALANTHRFDERGELDASHEDLAMEFDLHHNSKHSDVFIYEDDSEMPSKHKVVEIFAQLHKDDKKSENYLPNDVLMGVVATSIKDLDEKVKLAIERGGTYIEDVKKERGNAPSYDELKANGDNVVKNYLVALEKLYDHLYQIFPSSLVLQKDQNSRETGIRNLYDNVFVTSMSGVQERQETNPISAEAMQPISSRHEMNSAALQSSKAIDHSMYHTALSKYDDNHEMYKHIVNCTSGLVKKHLDDLEDPSFVASYKLLDKVSGIPKNDIKYLKRTGIDYEGVVAPATKTYTWVDLPVYWSEKDHGNNPNYRKVSAEQYQHVNADSEDVRHSLFYANANVPGAPGASISEAEPVSWSRKRSKQESIGASYAPTAAKLADSNTKYRYAFVKKIPQICERIAGIVFLTTKINKESLQAMHATDVLIPFDFMLARPFMSFEMYHAILCKAGQETGSTFVGHSDFQLGDDVRSKLHYGHYTFMAKSVVTNPKNVALMKNIFINDYVGGFNTEFYDWENAMDDKREQFYHSRNRPSIFCMMLPANSSLRNNPVDLRKDFPYYVSKLSFDTLSDPNYDSEYFVPNEVNEGNGILYRGMQYSYDCSKGSYSKVTIGTGHLGSNIYPGVMAVLTGQMKHMRQIDYVQHF
jgi:hypothetical protein